MNISLKSLQQSTHKHQLLSEVFSDVNFYKYRSQSNTDQYTPIKGFQIVKLRGPSRQSQLPSQQSQKTIKSIKKRNNSQTSLKVDLFKHVIELDDNEMHDKLISLYEIDLNMCKNLQLNRMIVQDKQQQLYSEDITNEILLMLSNTIDRIHQYINANNLERSELKKAHRRTAIEIEHQMQEFVNMMLTAISKRNLPLAKLIESAWKLICIAIEMILQNSKAEQDYIKQQVLNELQQEVDQLKQENQEIYNKYMEVSELNYKLQQTHKQEINVLNYQLTMAKMEFNDYKQSQEALSNLENATGSLKDVEINLKDTNKILNKIEENISNRDTQLFQTLKSVVQQHKMDKESQMSKSQKLVYRYQLKSLTNKQCQIASEFFNHPFIPYLELINNQSFDEKQVQQLLIDWFNSECIKQQFGTHPAQQRLEQISTYERKSIPDGFLNYLLKNDNINQLQNCVIYISQNLEMSDMNLLTKVDKYNRQIGIFFGSILQFEINSIEIDLLTYDKIRFLYAGLQQQSQEENQPQNQNKFQWYNFVITNLADLCNSIFPEYQEKVVSQQQTVVQLLLLIMQGESDKRKQQHKKLLDEFKNADNDLNQQKERMIKFVKELSIHYNYQYNELQLIQYAQALFDRYVRVYQTGRRRAGLEIGEWIAYTQELFQVANKMIQLKPHLHHQISMIEDLLYINKEFQVNTRLLERKESMIKKK